jgi:hypothetical protein
VTRFLAALLLTACTQAPPPATPASPPAPAPAPTVVVVRESSTPAVIKDQPPATKLKLGHFRNDDRGIGLTVDLTEKNASVAEIDPAKVRFDGEAKIWRLIGKHGPRGRIDYMRDSKHVLLHVYDGGQMEVFVPDPDDKASNDEIRIYRDADADPL